ncbi:MAG: hypothetical protein HKO98_12925 [Gemmatimonadetes bacterium]|nr:hypothetical protein [Gemmatimonadota bacterium]
MRRMRTLLLDLWYAGHVVAAEAVGRFPSPRGRTAMIEGLGWLAFQLSRDKRRRVERHVDLAFGRESDGAGKRAIARACFYEFWREMVDWVPGAIEAPLPEDVPVQGIDHLEQALAEGHGAILWESNGFGRRVQGKRVLAARGVHPYQTHGATHLGVLGTSPEPGTWIRRRLRERYVRRECEFVAAVIEIPLDPSIAGGRAYLRHLRRNRVLCMAGDGQIARRLYPVRLLGRTVQFAPGAVKLSRLSGAPLLPLFWVPEGDGAPALEIGPPLRPVGEGDEDVVRCLQGFADALEERVRRWPHAYRNWHMLGDGTSQSG